MLTASLIKGLALSDGLEQQRACVFKHFTVANMIINMSIEKAMEITAVMMIIVKLFLSVLASLMNLMFPIVTPKLPSLTYHGYKCLANSYIAR